MAVDMHHGTIERDLDRAADRWADEVGLAVVNAAKEHCPVDNGNLRASIEYAVDTPRPLAKRVTVGSASPIAEYFHTGTGIYGPRKTPIVPTRTENALGGTPFLKFTPKGANGPVFARSVRGMPAHPFLALGLEDVFGTLATTRTVD